MRSPPLRLKPAEAERVARVCAEIIDEWERKGYRGRLPLATIIRAALRRLGYDPPRDNVPTSPLAISIIRTRLAEWGYTVYQRVKCSGKKKIWYIAYGGVVVEPEGVGGYVARGARGMAVEELA